MDSKLFWINIKLCLPLLISTYLFLNIPENSYKYSGWNACQLSLFLLLSWVKAHVLLVERLFCKNISNICFSVWMQVKANLKIFNLCKSPGGQVSVCFHVKYVHFQMAISVKFLCVECYLITVIVILTILVARSCSPKNTWIQ